MHIARCTSLEAVADRATPGEISVLISSAYAQAAGASPSGELMTFLPMIGIFVIFYFLLIRPQQKARQRTAYDAGCLAKGDEVVTSGGVVGKIAKLTDQYASVEIAPNVEVNVQRHSIAQLLPKARSRRFRICLAQATRLKRHCMKYPSAGRLP